MHVSPFSNVDKPAWLGFCCHNLFMWKIQGSALLSCDQSKSLGFSSNSHDCKVWLLLSLNWEDLKVVKRRISYSNAKPILRTLSLLPNVGSEIYYCFSIRILSSFSKKCEILECYCYEMLSQLHRYWNKHWRLRKQGFDQSNPIFICDWIQEWQSPHLRYSP